MEKYQTGMSSRIETGGLKKKAFLERNVKERKH